MRERTSENAGDSRASARSVGPGVWWLAARPKTLPAAGTPVLIGTAMAVGDSGFHAPAAFCCLLGALLIQVATNYANDYGDYIRGADTDERLGPVRATGAGLVTPAAMKRATGIAFAMALLPGLYIVYRGGWPFVLVGLLSISCGLLYTFGPVPFGYTGLADVVVLVFFGPVAVGGTYYVQALHIDWRVLVAGLAPGLFSVAILTVNNLRDIDTDRRAGKKTLAVRFGRTFARAEYVGALVAASGGVPLASWLCFDVQPWTMIAAAALLPAIPTAYTVFTRREGASLNAALAATGRLLLIYGVTFSLGYLL